MPSRVAVEVHGARELRTALRRMNVEGANKALRQTHQKVAKFVEGRTRGKGTPQQQAAARALLGKGSQKSADLKIRNLASVPFGIAAFMGAQGRFGWYSAKRYSSSAARQFPDWVGNNWNLEAGIGPYVIADQIKRDRQEILDTYLEELAATADALGLQFQ
jgi:hypothetical protein